MAECFEGQPYPIYFSDNDGKAVLEYWLHKAKHLEQTAFTPSIISFLETRLGRAIGERAFSLQHLPPLFEDESIALMFLKVVEESLYELCKTAPNLGQTAVWDKNDRLFLLAKMNIMYLAYKHTLVETKHLPVTKIKISLKLEKEEQDCMEIYMLINNFRVYELAHPRALDHYEEKVEKINELIHKLEQTPSFKYQAMEICTFIEKCIELHEAAHNLHAGVEMMEKYMQYEQNPSFLESAEFTLSEMKKQIAEGK